MDSKQSRSRRLRRFSQRLPALRHIAERAGLQIASTNEGMHIRLFDHNGRVILHFWPSTYTAVFGQSTDGKRRTMCLDDFNDELAFAIERARMEEV